MMTHSKQSTARSPNKALYPSPPRHYTVDTSRIMVSGAFGTLGLVRYVLFSSLSMISMIPEMQHMVGKLHAVCGQRRERRVTLPGTSKTNQHQREAPLLQSDSTAVLLTFEPIPLSMSNDRRKTVRSQSMSLDK